MRNNSGRSGSTDMQVSSSLFLSHTHNIVHKFIPCCLDGEEIGPEGVEKFCADIDVAPEDVSELFLYFYGFSVKLLLY